MRVFPLPELLCRPNEDQVVQTIIGNDQFAKNMYSVISGEEGNIIFSPFSIHVCLSMLYQGSTGAIHAALEKALGVSHTTAAVGYKQIMQDIASRPEGTTQSCSTQSDPVTIEVADKIYLDQKLQLNDDFRNVLVEKFSSDVEQVDFNKAEEAVGNINHWVEEKTRQKFKDLLAAEDVRDAVLVLINAIYFKGAWMNPFNECTTRCDRFYLDSKNVIMVPMMEHTVYLLHKRHIDLDARVVVLPYFRKSCSNQFSMIIILPYKKGGIRKLEKKLVSKDIYNLVSNAFHRKVNIKLPKFKIEQMMDLQDSFEKLGLGSLFEPSQDLSGLIKSDDNIVVSKAVHKAFIEVNEKGTEAEVAIPITGNMDSDSYQSLLPALPFHVDRPFMFALVHHPRQATYRDVLFFGRVLKPEVA